MKNLLKLMLVLVLFGAVACGASEDDPQPKNIKISGVGYDNNGSSGGGTGNPPPPPPSGD